MALTSNPDLLSSVSALALGDIKSFVPCTFKSWLDDTMLSDYGVVEWKTVPTGRVQSQPELQDYRRVTVAEHCITMADIDFSWLEDRAIAHMLDGLEFYSTGALYGTTSQLSAEPEPLTLEKLEALMVEYGLMEPKRPKREHWAMWGCPYITVKNRFFDLETCAT